MAFPRPSEIAAGRRKDLFRLPSIGCGCMLIAACAALWAISTVTALVHLHADDLTWRKLAHISSRNLSTRSRPPSSSTAAAPRATVAPTSDPLCVGAPGCEEGNAGWYACVLKPGCRWAPLAANLPPPGSASPTVPSRPPLAANSPPPTAAPTAAQVRVSCVGDSITWGKCASDRAATSYPAQLQGMLGDGYKVSNFGDSGRTMQRSSRCVKCTCEEQVCDCPDCAPCDCEPGQDCPQHERAYSLRPAYNEALASEPDIVTIMLGTNDAKECNWYGTHPAEASDVGNSSGFVSDFGAMIDAFKHLAKQPRILVAVPPPVVPPSYHPNGFHDIRAVYNISMKVVNNILPDLERRIAEENGAELVDVWSAMGGNAMDVALTCDGCHPRDAGYKIIAKTLAAAIKK